MREPRFVLRWTVPSAPLRVRRTRKAWAKNDAKRDARLAIPETVERLDDLSYGCHGRWSLLDLYRPKNAEGPLPVIVSIHGGGYFYGTKETYQFYCMDLARRGFGVVNFNYRLAPEYAFPAPLEDTNAVLTWLCAHAEAYGLDTENVFLVGDSAGAQLASQYAALWADPDYAALFGLTVPALRLAAVGLNCGIYNLPALAAQDRQMATDYLEKHSVPEQLDVFAHIDRRYPPAYLISAPNDFLCDCCAPMGELLRSRGVEAAWQLYGTPEQKEVAHVFHCDLRLPEGQQANDDETAFFRRYLR